MDQLDLTVCEDEFLRLGRLLTSVCDRLSPVAVTTDFLTRRCHRFWPHECPLPGNSHYRGNARKEGALLPRRESRTGKRAQSYRYLVASSVRRYLRNTDMRLRCAALGASHVRHGPTGM
jgi:hypothetical protein